MTKRKIFYGWYIVFACFIFALVAVGLGNSSISLYVKPICDSMGLSREAFSMVFSIESFVCLIGSLTFGIAYKKIGSIKKILAIGVLFVAAAFGMFYLTNNLWMLYIGALFLGIGMMYVTTISFSVAVSNWFVDKKGLALGIIFSGTGIGGALLNPLVGHFIVAYGWRVSAVLSMFIVLVACVPALLIIKNKPSDIGLMPLGSEKTDNPLDPLEVEGMTLKSASKTSCFWCLLIAALLTGAAVAPIFLNSSAHMLSAGLDMQVVSFVMSGVFALNAIAKVLMGVVNDKYGVKPLIIIPFSAVIVSALVLIFVQGIPMGVSFALAFGIAYASTGIPLPLITAKLFGKKDYGTILGVVIGSYSLGVVIGNPIYGLIYDQFHSYTYAFSLSILLIIVTIAFLLISVKISEKSCNKNITPLTEDITSENQTANILGK